MVLFRQGPLDAMPQNRRVRDAEFAQNRGSILAAGKMEIATTVPSKDRFSYQRNYPAGSLYAPVTGYFSYDHASTGLENTYNTQLAGTADSLVRPAAHRPGDQPHAAGRERADDDRAQGAGGRGHGARAGQKGAVVALEPARPARCWRS